MTTTTTTLKIKCCPCKGHEKKINKALSKIQGIESVKVSLVSGLMIITGDIDTMKLVQELGKKNVKVLDVQKQGPQVAATATINQPKMEPGQSSTSFAATTATTNQTNMQPGQSSTRSVGAPIPQPGFGPQPGNGGYNIPRPPAPAGSNGSEGSVQQQPGLQPPGRGGFQPQHVPSHGPYGGPIPEQVYGQGYSGYGYQNGPYGAPIQQGYGPQVGPSSAWQGQQGPQSGPNNAWQGQPAQNPYGYGNMQQNYYSPLSEEDPNACSVM